MKYSIDKIENNIATLENIDTQEIIEVDILLLPEGSKESSIIIQKNEQYILDKQEEKKRKENLFNRFSKLKKNK